MPAVDITPVGHKPVGFVGEEGFLPTDLDGITLWLRASSLDLSDGEAVSLWEDESGQGNDATQATAGEDPVLKTGIINSEPVVRFDGTDDNLDLPDLPFAGNDEITIAVVFQSTSFASAQWFIQGQSEVVLRANTNNTLEFILNSFTSNDRVASTGTVSVDTPALVVGIFDGADLKIRLNGGQDSVTPSGTYGDPNSWGISGTEQVSGDIAEIVIDKGSSGVSDIESYLNDKYAIF